MTRDEITEKITELLLGNSVKKIRPHKITEICKVTGFDSRTTIYGFLDRGVELGLLKKSDSGRYVLPELSHAEEFQKFNDSHRILDDPIVSDWFDDLLNRKQGKGVKISQQLLTTIEKICNTCHIQPAQIIASKENAEEIKKNYLTAYREHRIVSKHKQYYSADIENIDYTTSYAIASICGYYGIAWARGTSKMSRKIVGHAKYSDIRLTDEELENADEYLKTKNGVDSNVYRIFWLGIETCARNEALFSMKLDYTKNTSKKGKTTYYFTAYESKTKQIKGGKWTKYVKRESTQKSIDFLKERGSTYIYDNLDNTSLRRLKDEIKNQLLDLYVFLGKITNLAEIRLKRKQEHKISGNYWYDHAFHVLRHVGAHYHLRKTKYNYGYVAVLGGWHTIDELKKSYGEIPPEVLDELLEEYDY